MSTALLAVVGAGPAGMAAAAAAAERGAHVCVLDDMPRAGGQIHRRAAPETKLPSFATERERARRDGLLARIRGASERIEHLTDASVYALHPDLEIHFERGGKTHRLRPAAVVVATGVSEFSIPFPGWTLPGVSYAGGVQSLLKEHCVLAGHRIAVAGAGPLPVAVAAQLRTAGAEIACVALYRGLEAMARRPLALASGIGTVVDGLCHLARLRGVPLLADRVPVRADGDASGVRSLTLSRRDREGAPREGTERTFEIDAVALGFGLAPNTELLRMAGAAMRLDTRSGGWIPERTPLTATTVPGLFAAGDCAGVRGALAAEAEGELAGLAALGLAHRGDPAHMRSAIARATRIRARHARFHEVVADLSEIGPGAWRIGGAETVVCRCEGVTRGAVEAAACGQPDLNGVKRITRAGMGPCGGRGCLRALAALCGNGADTGPLTARPPARPVSLAALATRAEP